MGRCSSWTAETTATKNLTCDGNLSFSDADADGTAGDAELGAELVCAAPEDDADREDNAEDDDADKDDADPGDDDADAEEEAEQP